MELHHEVWFLALATFRSATRDKQSKEGLPETCVPDVQVEHVLELAKPSPREPCDIDSSPQRYDPWVPEEIS